MRRGKVRRLVRRQSERIDAAAPLQLGKRHTGIESTALVEKFRQVPAREDLPGKRRVPD